jgi:asparagine synthetase B (glutamine-hydrolysing)
MNLIHTLGIENTIRSINGDFAMVYTDGKRLLAARDPVGVRPMFYTRYANDSIAFASEAKALLFLKTPIHIFPPGHFYDSYVDRFICYYTGYWNIHKFSTTKNLEKIRHSLEDAVHMRLDNTDREMGFLLSGGLDSSLIAAIAARKIGRIRTFSIGLEGSPDLEAARRVSDFLATDHTEVTFTVEEGLQSKDGMSDAVGEGWVGAIRKYTESNDENVVNMLTRHPQTRDMCKHNIPLTNEEAYYREVFWMYYGIKNDHLISEIWRPKWTTVTDPSARLLIEKNPS